MDLISQEPNKITISIEDTSEGFSVEFKDTLHKCIDVVYVTKDNYIARRVFMEAIKQVTMGGWFRLVNCIMHSNRTEATYTPIKQYCNPEKKDE